MWKRGLVAILTGKQLYCLLAALEITTALHDNIVSDFFFFFVLKKWKQDTFILLLWIPTIEIKLLCTKTGMLGLNPDFFWEIFLPKLIFISLPVLTRGCRHSGSVCLGNSGIKEKEGRMSKRIQLAACFLHPNMPLCNEKHCFKRAPWPWCSHWEHDLLWYGTKFNCVCH